MFGFFRQETVFAVPRSSVWEWKQSVSH